MSLVKKRATGPSTFGFPIDDEPNKIDEEISTALLQRIAGRVRVYGGKICHDCVGIEAGVLDPLCNSLTPSLGKRFRSAWTR